MTPACIADRLERRQTTLQTVIFVPMLREPELHLCRAHRLAIPESMAHQAQPCLRRPLLTASPRASPQLTSSHPASTAVHIQAVQEPYRGLVR